MVIIDFDFSNMSNFLLPGHSEFNLVKMAEPNYFSLNYQGYRLLFRDRFGKIAQNCGSELRVFAFYPMNQTGGQFLRRLFKNHLSSQNSPFYLHIYAEVHRHIC